MTRKRKYKLILTSIAVAPVAFLAITSLFSCAAPELGLVDGKLSPCPDKPNCVNSQDPSDDHVIDPIEFDGDPQVAWDTLVEILQERPRTEITTATGDYIRAETWSFLFRFTDDLEFLLDRDGKQIHVRSASRVGYSDLGVNRERVEEIRAAIAAGEKRQN